MARFKNKKIDMLFSYVMIFIGVILIAFGVSNFLAKNNVLDGGVTGVGMIITNFIPVPLAIVTFIINIPFMYLGYKNLGLHFLFKMFFSIFVFSIFLTLFNGIEPLTNDLLLSVVFGGVIIGVGVGLTINFGGCNDGLDCASIVINRKTDISVGKVTLFFNCIIFMISGFLFGFDKCFYAILRYFVTFKAIDFVSDIMQNAKAVLIVTDDGKEISNDIYKYLGRTVTRIQGRGLLSGDKDVLYCVISRLEIYQLKKLIDDKYSNTFITIINVENIYGEFVKSKTLKEKLDFNE